MGETGVSDFAGVLPVPFTITDTDEETPLHAWLRSVLAAEFESRGPQRTLQNGARFGEAWPSLAELVTQCPGDNIRDRRDANLTMRAAQVCAILSRWDGSGEDVADHAVLDSIRGEINEGSLPSVINSADQPRSSNVAAFLVQNAADGNTNSDYLAGRVIALEKEASVLFERLADNSEALSAARVSSEDAQRALKQKTEEVDELAHRLAAKDRRVAELSALIAQSQAEVTALQAQPLLAAAKADALAWRDQLAAANSRLRQRDEELAQVWAELAELRTALAGKAEALAAQAIEVEKLSGQLAGSEAWVFKLAGERRLQEDALSAAQTKLKRASVERDRAQEALERERNAHVAASKVQRDPGASIETGQIPPARVDDGSSDQSTAQAREEALEERDLAVSLLTVMVARAEAAESANIAAQHDIDDVRGELERLVRAGAARELEQEQQLSDALADVYNLSQELLAARADAQGVARDILGMQAQAQENAQRLVEAVDQSEELRASVEWVRQISLASQHRRWWWSLLPGSYARRKILKRVHRLGLFDGDAYLQLYPDVKSEGMCPLQHYLSYGIAEGRQRPQ